MEKRKLERMRKEKMESTENIEKPFVKSEETKRALEKVIEIHGSDNEKSKANQLDISIAKTLTLEKMLSDGNLKTKYSLSKADIILIFTVYGNLDKFYHSYMKYVKHCIDIGYSYCQPPHYYLKYKIR